MGLWMNTRGNPTAMWARSYSLTGQAPPASSPNEERENPNLIEGFDGVQASDELLRRWQVSTDSDASAHSMAEISLLTPGSEGTRHAMRLTGRLAPGPKNAQGIVSARCEVRLPANSAALRGLEFEARGVSRIFQVGFKPPKTAATFAVPAISFVPGEDWQDVRMPIAWLADPAKNGLANGPWTLEIMVAGPPGEFTLDLDEIRSTEPEFRRCEALWEETPHPARYSRHPLSTGEGVTSIIVDGPLPWSLCENQLCTVIPSEAWNLALSVFNALRDSSSPAAPPKITSFPRKRESTGWTTGSPLSRGRHR